MPIFYDVTSRTYHGRSRGVYDSSDRMAHYTSNRVSYLYIKEGVMTKSYLIFIQVVSFCPGIHEFLSTCAP